ncbi:MAG TPA: glycosyltransferase family 1 protein [Daejeonella sp.]|nr:glycosyltransferase family 1 protein [Daejeonella sp.]
MKISFDGKRAARNFTGLGNYSRYIIELLARNFPENQYQVYSPSFPQNRQLERLRSLSSVSFHQPQQRFLKSFWRSWGILKDLQKNKVDLYHGLSNEIPLGIKKTGIPAVVTIHDLIFLRYPHYFPWIDRQIYLFKFRYACKHANKIIAVSEQTKRDIVHYFKIPENRIEVIYQNCDPIFSQRVSEIEKQRIRSTYKLPQKYLLNVGTIEVRKNLLLLIKALEQTDPEIPLVVIGKDTAYASKVKQYIKNNLPEGRVFFLKNVPFGDLPGIYQQAEMFIYPSEYEGFGIPIVEALHSGIPVIAATGSCLEEAGGPQSLYVSPDNPHELSQAINAILTHPLKKQEMVRAGFEYIERFSDQNIAGKTMTLYQNLHTKC